MSCRKYFIPALLLIALGVSFLWAKGYIFKHTSIVRMQSNGKVITALSVGVVDINRIKGQSRVFQKFKEVLNNLHATIHKEVLEKETSLRNEYEQFRKREEEAKEPTQELIKLKTELDKKHAALEKIVRKRREELDEEYTKGLVNIKQVLKEIMDDLGKEHNLNIILNKSIGDGNQMDQSIVLFCNEGFDLTDEVIQRLDKQIPLKSLERK